MTPSPDIVAYRAAVRDSVPEAASWLLENVGQRITTVGLGLADARLVRRYTEGDARPHPERERRLRLLYRVARMVAEAYDTEVARAFLVSSNPDLGDVSPVIVIAEGGAEGEAQVLEAARVLIEG